MGVKMEVDYSTTVEEKIPKAKELAAQNKLDDALEMLIALEKQTRTGCDMHSTSKVLVAIVQICFEVRVLIWKQILPGFPLNRLLFPY